MPDSSGQCVGRRSVQLVTAPRDQVVSPISRSGAYQPLGILSIASYLLECCGDTSVELLDGEFFGVSEIETRLCGDVVGISSTTPSYRNALRLARAAKQRGAVVVLGGAHATALGETILANRPEIDFLVRGDGECAFAELVSGHSPADICNLVFRKGSHVVANPVRAVPFSSIPQIRRDLLPLAPYAARYRARPDAIPSRIPAALVSQKGCLWRHQSGGCVFCGRLDKGWRARPPAAVWREVMDLSRSWGVNYLWDVSDSFVSSPDWVLRFAAERPRRADMGLFVYARSCELHPEVVKALESVGCQEIFVGMESGNDSLLRAANKGTTKNDNLKAAALLAAHRIKMFPCFVFGLPGETEASVGETIEHAKALSRIGEWSTVSASVFVPLPGSTAFDLLRQHTRACADEVGTDLLDVETLARLWVERFCSVSWEAIHQAIRSILDLCPRKSSFFNFQ